MVWCHQSVAVWLNVFYWLYFYYACCGITVLSPFVQFSVFSSWTADRPVGCSSRHGRNSYGLSKAEFMEKEQQSNEACQSGDFQAAVELYTEALQADPQSCILYSNRSAALLKLGRHQEALDDAGQACELNPKWPKVSLLPLNWSKPTTCSEMFSGFMNNLKLDSSWRLHWGLAESLACHTGNETDIFVLLFIFSLEWSVFSSDFHFCVAFLWLLINKNFLWGLVVDLVTVANLW